MERWQLINKALAPVDKVVGAGFDALKNYGVYQPFKDKTNELFKKTLRMQFDAQYKLEVVGEHNIPETGGCLIASNHRSWLDAQILGSCTNRRFFFVAKADFRDWPMMRHLIDLTDGIYVTRGGDSKTLDEITAAVKEGKAVVIFPEGTIPGEEDIPRWEVEKDTGLLRGRSGVVRVALETGCPIIPVGLSGTGQAFPPEAYPRMQQLPLPQPHPVTVSFGAPITFSKPAKVTREDLAKKTKVVMKAISAQMDFSREYEPVTLPIQDKVKPSFLPKYAYSSAPAKDGAKAPLGVVVIHGFTSDVHCVDALVEPLKKEGLSYRFPILRGHGSRFQDMEGTTNRDWYEDAENAMLDLYQECEKVLVVGLSMGGLCALEIAARHRDKVAGVAAVAAALKFMDPLAGLAPMLSRVVRFWPSPNSYNDIELKKRENRNYPKFSTAALGSLLEFAASTKNILSFVNAPILILQSRKDQIVDPSAARLIYEKVSSKDKNIVWFDRSGHEMMLDMEAQSSVSTVMTFIRRIKNDKSSN